MIEYFFQEAIPEDSSLEEHARKSHNLNPNLLDSILALQNNGVRGGPAAAADSSPLRDNDKNANGEGETGENSPVTAVGGDLSIGSISTKHVYKFRCNYCSLAFRTQVKFNFHVHNKKTNQEIIYFKHLLLNFNIGSREETEIAGFFVYSQ